jgi:hypothetical protein
LRPPLRHIIAVVEACQVKLAVAERSYVHSPLGGQFMPAMLAFLRSLDPLRVASVCTGALILGAAGLLRLPRRRQPGAAPSPEWRDRRGRQKKPAHLLPRAHLIETTARPLFPRSLRPGHPCGSVHFSRMGSADRSPTARPCRPATAFDFRQPLARGRARPAREGKCWHFYAPADPLQPALRLAPLIIPVV